MVASLIARAGYAPDESVVVATRWGAQPAEIVTQGPAFTGTSLIYTASLSKQLTAACVALLARSGRLGADDSLARWLPELPSWAAAVRLRHLVHHTAGLPADDDLHLPPGTDRTTDGVIDALCRSATVPSPPGVEFRYSNAGYVCLGRAVARAAGQPLPDVARDLLFAPLGMADTTFWAGPAPRPPGGVPPAAGHPAPLSLGDGGAWSTAADLLRWAHAMNTDALGVSALLETPGTLAGGRPLDYAWGVGVRVVAGLRAYRHGGGYPGVRLLLVRVPEAGLGLLVAAADSTERHVALTDALLARAL